MKKAIIIISLIIIGLNQAVAQTEEVARTVNPKIPRLNGHMFLSTSYLRSSFTNTSLQADLGIGITSPIEIPGITIEDIEIPGFEGSILFFDMNVQYQQNFRPWLALFASMKVGGRLGTDMSTIVVDGVNTLSGGDIGWLMRIKETQKFNLSGTISLLKIVGNFVNVSEYIEEIIDDNPEASVTKKVPAMSAVVGLRGAYAFNSMYGLQFHAEYAYGESLARGKSQGYYSLGLLGDMDFNPSKNVPIGLALGYTLTTSQEMVMSDGGISNVILGKIGYTGSNDFELGAQFTYYNVNLKKVDDNPFITKILMTLKFYF